MWRSGACLLCLIFGLISRPAQAAHSFRLELSPRFLTPDDIAPLSAFLRQVERTVPPRVQARIAQTVVVSFDHAPEGDAAGEGREVRVPRCPEEDSAVRAATPPPSQELGFLQLAGDRGSPHRIHLHRGFAAVVRAGPDEKTRYPCGHRSLYRLAVATVLHEVMHAYDAQVGLSDDPRYRHLVRFDRQGILRRLTPRNQLWSRSPDPYEGHSLAESLAVNVEYFLLDPEYRCRRPASYRFFEQALRYRPYPQAACEQNYTVYYRGEALSLNPERIYQVHYVLAARGQGIGSRFGHSMFRLVVCNESRTKVGPECMADVQDHIVIGFGANLGGELQISPWKGLTGGYLSQLFIKPFPVVLIEYTEQELRALDSLPLRLSSDEQRQLVLRVLEIYWSYASRYFFLSNNCASESLSLLKSASSHPGLQRIHVISPSGLRDELLRNGMIELPPPPEQLTGEAAQRQREREGLYFPSQLGRYEAAYAALRPLLPASAPTTLRGYSEQSDARQRRAWLAALSSLPNETTGQLAAQAFALEGWILNRRLADAERKLTRFVLLNREQSILKDVQALLPRLGIELPWLGVAPGYGIPFRWEVRRPPDRDRDAVAQALFREAQRLLQTYFPAELGEWQRTQDNRRALIEQILRAASGPSAERPLVTAQAPLGGS